MSRSALDELAIRCGLGEAYHDHRGELKIFSPATKIALLASMGVAADSSQAAADALRDIEIAADQEMVPRVMILRAGEPHILPLAAALLANAASIDWILRTEAGDMPTGSIDVAQLRSASESSSKHSARLAWPLPDMPLGFHQLTMRVDTGRSSETTLIVVPQRCHEPSALANDRRLWGLTLQLYSLRSANNWGMGDFGDLAEAIEAAAPLGCAFIGLNPLHALMPADPTHCSPYSPSSRQFLNIFYIAVPRVPEFTQCIPAANFLARHSVQTRLSKLRDASHVDYVRVAKLKLPVLRMLYEEFRSRHLAAATPRARIFQDFVRDGGEPLRLHAIFDALHTHLRGRSKKYGGWPGWPKNLRDPGSSAVRSFIEKYAADVEFYLYLQWLAADQLDQVQQLARQRGMTLGLYGDVAVGVNAGGSETWSNPRLYVTTAAIGAPPDPLALKGQDWGIPPQNPHELKAQCYQPFIDLLRFNMRHVGALRLDHVMALFRQWWVPSGRIATEGAYVHYPLDDLMGILALESSRNRCMVIGEDLGTVPDAVREAMRRYAVAHYKILLFEHESDGHFKAPGSYERWSIAAVTTHDLPTFRGWWEGADIELAGRLDLYPDAGTYEQMRDSRERDRRFLMQALVTAGLWYWQEHEALPPASHALMRATHLYLSLSTAALTAVQIEDLAGMSDPVNVPGTHLEYPNWQRKVSEPVPVILAREEVREMLRAMGIARTGRNPN